MDRISYNELHLRLLEEFAPPSLVVNAEHEIVHVSPRAGKYLEVAGGEPTNSLHKLIRPVIRMELRGALYQAQQQKSNVELRGLSVGSGDQAEIINVLVRPVMDESDTARGFVLIAFEPIERSGEETQAAVE